MPPSSASSRLRLAPHLSYKSALALLPPPSITPPIESVRRVHDKNFARWPPHINLIYPFLASPSELDSTAQHPDDGANDTVPLSPKLKQDIHMRIHNAVKSIRPFSISLKADPAGTFSHSANNKTVWLGPSAQFVQQLQATLQTEFSECDANQRTFVPHLSVGQAHSDKAAQNLAGQIKKSIAEYMRSSTEDGPVQLEWYVDKLYVIERKGFHDRFKVIGEIELKE